MYLSNMLGYPFSESDDIVCQMYTLSFVFLFSLMLYNLHVTKFIPN